MIESIKVNKFTQIRHKLKLNFVRICVNLLTNAP